MKKIIVLGAGFISKPLVHFLLDQPEYCVYVADQKVSKAKESMIGYSNGFALALDVNDDDSIAKAMAVVQAESGMLDFLINNAGFSQVGAVVDLSREQLRRQYETNVIAPVAVVRAALPLLRKSVSSGSVGHAVIVNVGSIVGIFTTPFAAAYCSSKAAIHSVSDALRMELAPLGIRVVIVQPGGVRSAFGDHAEEALSLPENSIYALLEKNENQLDIFDLGA